MLTSVADWLTDTSLSVFLRRQTWLIPVSQSIHIFCICLVFGSAALISARLLGFSRGGRSIPQLVSACLPWMYGALWGLLLTGLLQTIAEPRRQFSATVFWLKMVMVIVVTALTLIFGRQVRQHSSQWREHPTHSVYGRIFAVTSLLLWIGIIVCGRFIAYTYTDYR